MATRWGALVEEEELEEEGRGRSKRKRESRTFDAMALELLELSDDRCKKLPVTENLKKSLHAARTTRAKTARRRHIRHLSGLLRDSKEEVLAIQNYLSGQAFVAVHGDEEYRDLEELRESLCDAVQFEEALGKALDEHPYLDIALMRKLADRYHQDKDEKSYRGIFKELRRAADESELDAEQL